MLSLFYVSSYFLQMLQYDIVNFLRWNWFVLKTKLLNTTGSIRYLNQAMFMKKEEESDSCVIIAGVQYQIY